MFIKSISVENFRSYKEKKIFDDLKRINVFVGANGTGKSNIILILDFLNKLARNDNTDIYIQNVFDHDNNRAITVELDLFLNTKEKISILTKLTENIDLNFKETLLFDRLKIRISLFHTKFMEESILFSNNKGEYEYLNKHIIENSNLVQYLSDIDERLAKSPSIEDLSEIQLKKANISWSNGISLFNIPSEYKNNLYKIADWIIEFLRKNIKMQVAHRFINFENVDANQVHSSLSTTGDNILTVLSSLHQNDFEKLYSILQEFKIINVKNLKFKRTTNNKIEQTFLQDFLNSEFQFNSLSYGSQQMLIMILSIKLHTNILLCIEEPEVYLHSYLQKKLFEYIKQNDTDIQFFITTHSPNFVSMDSNSRVYLVTKDEGFSHAISIENDNELKIIKQKLGIDNADIYLTNIVIFVEGPTEVNALRKIGGYPKYQKLKREVGIIPYGGDGKIERLTEFVNYLQYFDTTSIIIGDGQTNTTRAIENLKRTKKIEAKSRAKDKQFEDLFFSEYIVEAMKKLYNNEGFEFNLTVEDLNKERDNHSVANILSNLLEENGQILNKVDLANELTTILIKNMTENNNIHIDKTDFEKELDWIMEIIDKNSSQ